VQPAECLELLPVDKALEADLDRDDLRQVEEFAEPDGIRPEQARRIGQRVELTCRDHRSPVVASLARDLRDFRNNVPACQGSGLQDLQFFTVLKSFGL
jgi:hypothetical protein